MIGIRGCEKSALEASINMMIKRPGLKLVDTSFLKDDFFYLGSPMERLIKNPQCKTTQDCYRERRRYSHITRRTRKKLNAESNKGRRKTQTTISSFAQVDHDQILRMFRQIQYDVPGQSEFNVVRSIVDSVCFHLGEYVNDMSRSEISLPDKILLQL